MIPYQKIGPETQSTPYQTDNTDLPAVTTVLGGKTYTFLFTDVEGSTRLWEQQPHAMSVSLNYHNTVLTRAVESHHGKIFKNLGDGFCAVFDRAWDGLNAAVEAQCNLYNLKEQGNPPTIRLKVRMGLHTGPAEEQDNDYFGPTLNRAARLMAVASGGQVLVSSTTQVYLREVLPTDIELRDLGKHRLRDLNEPEHIFQVVTPELPHNFLPIKSLSPRPTNLPAQLTSFIGRDRELKEICHRMRQSDVRLLTLLGPGGIGKTRLSIQVGESLHNEYTDGVFMVALAPVKQVEAVLDTVAQALKVEETADKTLIESVKAYLQDRHLLLILDNFEQVVDVAPTINDLLATAPRLKVLVTSREELLVYGEHLYNVSSLTLPEENQAGDLNTLMQSSAVMLFTDRVQAAQPDFVLDQTNAPVVAEICRRLDGLPLAIELASVRTRDLPLEEIANQLHQRLNVLNKGPRDLPVRQRTMRGAIEWSYELLPFEEQQAFARLGVFVGQFTIEAVDSVVGAQTLNRLKEKSLIQQVFEEKNIVAFEMLETLREYAIERLVDLAEYETLQRYHAAYYLQMINAAEPNLIGESQIEWFNRLKIEQYNLLAALQWMLEKGQIEQAGCMTGVLWRFWGASSQLSTGSHWIEQVLAHSRSLSTCTHAKVTQGAGRLRFLQNNFMQAAEYLQVSMELYVQRRDEQGQAAIGMNLGEIALDQGENQAAEKYFRKSLLLYTTLGDQAGVARCLDQLGRVAIREKNLAHAELLFQQSLDLTRQYGSAESTAMVMNDLAEVLRTRGNYSEAATLYHESLALYRELGFDMGVAVILHNLGQTARKTGDNTEALEAFREALSLLQDMEEKQIIAECFAGLGSVHLDMGNVELATRYLSISKTLLDAVSIPLDYPDQVEYEQTLNSTQARLSESTWNNLWFEAQSMPLEQMITEALIDWR